MCLRLFCLATASHILCAQCLILSVEGLKMKYIFLNIQQGKIWQLQLKRQIVFHFHIKTVENFYIVDLL